MNRRNRSAARAAAQERWIAAQYAMHARLDGALPRAAASAWEREIFETPTVTAASFKQQYAALEDYTLMGGADAWLFSRRWQLPDGEYAELRDLNSRSQKVAMEETNRLRRAERYAVDAAIRSGTPLLAPGMAGTPQAILLDPLVPLLDGDDLRRRVQVILADSLRRPGARPRVRRIALASAAGAFPGTFIAHFTASPTLAVGVGLGFTWYLSGLRLPRRKRPVIDFDLAMLYARSVRYRAQLLTSTTGSAVTPDASVATAAACLDPHGGAAALSASEKARLLESARSALARLDREWFAYEHHPDHLRDYYIDRPLLRDGTVPATARYNEALYDLRELVDALTPTSTDDELRAADRAAEHALTAWSDAWDYAYEMKTTDRSAEERHALNRLFKLASQLRDEQTPREMWTGLIERMSRELNKIRTVPVNHGALPDQLGIEAGRTLQLALTAAPATVPLSATESEARP